MYSTINHFINYNWTINVYRTVLFYIRCSRSENSVIRKIVSNCNTRNPTRNTAEYLQPRTQAFWWRLSSWLFIWYFENEEWSVNHFYIFKRAKSFKKQQYMKCKMKTLLHWWDLKRVVAINILYSYIYKHRLYPYIHKGWWVQSKHRFDL